MRNINEILSDIDRMGSVRLTPSVAGEIKSLVTEANQIGRNVVIKELSEFFPGSHRNRTERRRLGGFEFRKKLLELLGEIEYLDA